MQFYTLLSRYLERRPLYIELIYTKIYVYEILRAVVNMILVNGGDLLGGMGQRYHTILVKF